jgi:hypothetical protein
MGEKLVASIPFSYFVPAIKVDFLNALPNN